MRAGWMIGSVIVGSCSVPRNVATDYKQQQAGPIPIQVSNKTGANGVTVFIRPSDVDTDDYGPEWGILALGQTASYSVKAGTYDVRAFAYTRMGDRSTTIETAPNNKNPAPEGKDISITSPTEIIFVDELTASQVISSKPNAKVLKLHVTHDETTRAVCLPPGATTDQAVTCCSGMAYKDHSARRTVCCGPVAPHVCP